MLFLALCIPIRAARRAARRRGASAARRVRRASRASAPRVPHGALAVAPDASLGAARRRRRARGRSSPACVATSGARLRSSALRRDRAARRRAARAAARAAFTELHMIDVGQGDAIALRTPHGHWMLFDAGRSWRGGDAGRSRPSCRTSRIAAATVALFVLSHPHTDHVGGAARVFAALHPARFLDAGYAGTSPPYRASLDEARATSIPWQRVHPGDSLVVDGVVLTMLAPDSAWTSRARPIANLASIGARSRASATCASCFIGDAEGPEEEWLLAHDPAALARRRAQGRAPRQHDEHDGALSRRGASAPRAGDRRRGQHVWPSGRRRCMRALRARGRAGACARIALGTIVVRTDGRRLEVETRDGESMGSLPPRASRRACVLMRRSARSCGIGCRCRPRLLARYPELGRRALAARRHCRCASAVGVSAARRCRRSRCGARSGSRRTRRSRRNYSCTNSGTSTSLRQIAPSRCATSGGACGTATLENRFEVDARAYRRAPRWPALLPPCRGSPVVQHTATSVVTIERFIIEQERLHPEATGELSGILYDLALAAKMIANKVRSAGLADILGATDDANVQGEIQQKLDVFANEIIVKAMDHGGRLCAMASEEEPGIIQIPERLQVRQVLPAVRSARRLVEHRRQRARRHDLLRRAEDHARPARRDGGHAAARAAAGRGGLRHLRLEHDARVHHGAGRARLHARSVDRRVPALASEHPHSRRRPLSLGERLVRAAVGRADASS